MTIRSSVVCLTLFALAGPATAQDYDFYRNLRYPTRLVPGTGRNTVEQEGGPDARGYRRRTVKWWPRKGQDIVDIPKGAPLRVWTRNKGQKDTEALAGVCRNWTASDAETFKAHLVAFRGFGTSTVDPNLGHVLVPAVVLRMENGEQRAVVNYGPVSSMLSDEDHDFIQKTWEDAYPKLYATVSQEDCPMPARPPGGAFGDVQLKLWEAARPRFNALDPPAQGAKYPRWGWRGDDLVFETPHFHTIARPKVWGKPAYWIRPDDVEQQNLYRKHVLEFVENFWTYVEAAGASMPYWRRFGLNYKYIIHIHDERAAGGWGHCGIGDCSPHILGHEFFHGQPTGNWDGHFIETMCNSGQHTAFPGELQMFNGNFQHPWRNVNWMTYQSSLWFFALGDNPDWGYAIQAVAGCLAAAAEPMPYHTIARLGQKRGLWANGIKGFGDFFGEYAARMVTCDFIEQPMIRTKYGMPEMSYVYPVYGQANRYRIANAEEPRPYGFNIVRLKPAEGAKEITVDFHGIYDPQQHSDWRACIVAVDADGRARYSPLWNKGKMRFALKPSDKHLWLTVAATPGALPIRKSARRGMSYRDVYLMGVHAPRYPWEVTLAGCRPGLPHRRPGDVVNFDELYGISNGNTYLNYPVRQEVPIPLAEADGRLAHEKLAAMRPRIKASADALEKKIVAGLDHRGWWESKKTMMFGDLYRRIDFLQRNAKGRRHSNGGGFVADGARVAPTAYVGPNAMVLDGARVEGNACIKDFAVILGPKTIISGHAKVGGRAWVFGDITVDGNARILEAATVTTLLRMPRTPSQRYEGRGRITGSAVIKGEHFLFLCYATDQTVTGGVVMDYTPEVENRQGGVFDCGRFYQPVHGRFTRGKGFDAGVDAGALYANWQFNQRKATLLEDSYVNNNGILHGRPGFADNGEHRCIIFNGKDQYAEAPPSVADFWELTVDVMMNWSGRKGGKVFDFGTGEDECFALALAGPGGKPTLTARHKGKSCSLTAPVGVAANRWVRVRVEMDGSSACIYVDGKRVAKGAFAFRPRMVFIGDRPEGNFIACSRSKDEFFKGKIDHFRIYRKVHHDFNALGPPPFALTQMQEWSEEDQQRADEWDGRRRAKEAELKAGKYGRLQDEIRQLNERKSALFKTAKLHKLEARVRQVEEAKRALDRKNHDEFRARPDTVKAEREIKPLREKIDGIMRRIRLNSEYVKLTEDIRSREKQRQNVEREIRESPALKAISARAEAADQEKRTAEERIGRLPELRKLLELSERETDNEKKKELRDRHSRLLQARRLADPKWQKADVAQRRLRREHYETLRAELDGHVGRKRLEGELNELRDNQHILTAKLRKSHSELLKLEKSVAAKQTALQTKRSRFEERFRAGEAYKNAVAASAAVRQAVEQERKRLKLERKGQLAEIAARVETLQKESRAIWNSAMRSARLLGPNPYPGKDAARLKAFQENMVHHNTADWDDRTREEVSGRVPAKMKRWLKRVRGY